MIAAHPPPAIAAPAAPAWRWAFPLGYPCQLQRWPAPHDGRERAQSIRRWRVVPNDQTNPYVFLVSARRDRVAVHYRWMELHADDVRELTEKIPALALAVRLAHDARHRYLAERGHGDRT